MASNFFVLKFYSKTTNKETKLYLLLKLCILLIIGRSAYMAILVYQKAIFVIDSYILIMYYIINNKI